MGQRLIALIFVTDGQLEIISLWSLTNFRPPNLGWDHLMALGIGVVVNEFWYRLLTLKHNHIANQECTITISIQQRNELKIARAYSISKSLWLSCFVYLGFHCLLILKLTLSCANLVNARFQERAYDLGA